MNSEMSFVLIWKPVTQKTREGSYVLLKCQEDGELFSCGGSYEQGKFWYSYDREYHREIAVDTILGWDYYPYNE